jgi:GT2 family glycosyltransferase
LQSVFEKTEGVSFEVIVVDNGSQDGSQEMIRLEFPTVTLIESAENFGFGSANNAGAEQAKGKYLFLLNPDTVLLNNACQLLFNFIENTPPCGICGGNLFNGQKKPIHSYYRLLPSALWELSARLNHWPLKLWFGENFEFNHTHKPQKVAMITGADLMIRADLFNRLHGFDADFFLYYEDTHLSFKVKQAGYKAYSVPQAEIWHLEGQSMTNINSKRQLIIRNSRKLYYRKTHNKFYCFVIAMILFPGNIIKKMRRLKK